MKHLINQVDVFPHKGIPVFKLNNKASDKEYRNPDTCQARCAFKSGSLIQESRRESTPDTAGKSDPQLSSLLRIFDKAATHEKHCHTGEKRAKQRQEQHDLNKRGTKRRRASNLVHISSLLLCLLGTFPTDTPIS